MEYLQNDPLIDPERLVGLEWLFLPLARHDDFEPKLLHAEVSQNPAFFAEILTLIYQRKDQPRTEGETLEPTKQKLADAAYSLLESWTGIPGQKANGTIDPVDLDNWIAAARDLCQANGRLEVCDTTIGEQLSYAPADTDGTWPCLPVRDVLETVTTDEILRGFNRGVHNQRGVTSRGMKDGGEQERALVKNYLAYAEKCKVLWPRAALALRRIAEGYEADAKWQDEHAEARD